MGCFQMRSSALAVATILLLLLASCQPSSSLQQHQLHLLKMLNASAPSPSTTSGGAGFRSARRVDVSGCSDPEELVTVSQSPAASLPTGMPVYSVEITNRCLDCTVCGVHLSCGDFANTELVDPATFHRLGLNDCLVNNGGAIGAGEMVPFHYSNSFQYPMKVASASCDCH